MLTPEQIAEIRKRCEYGKVGMRSVSLINSYRFDIRALLQMVEELQRKIEALMFHAGLAPVKEVSLEEAKEMFGGKNEPSDTI